VKILVTGSTGFLGRHLVPLLQNKYQEKNIIALSSKDYNLMVRDDVKRMFLELKPTVIIHLAAYSGGIGINSTKPADFYFINITLQSLMFEEAAKYGHLDKLVYPMGGCSYPSTAISPISEDQMWQGYPQDESAGYSAAKKMGIVASRSYRTQYGLKTSVIIPGNMYGEYDNFRTAESHVVPAFIRRYYEEMKSGAKEITMWGTGSPQRDFVYAGDVAAAIPYFIEEYDSVDPVNISTGTSITILELAETLKSTLGFQGEIVWDTSKPDGQIVKIFDVTKFNSLGLKCPTTLAQGLNETINWFTCNYDNRSDGIRL
jgi:GDP-L-fucose synthase